MKKTTIAILALTLGLSLTACGGKEKDVQTKNEVSTETRIEVSNETKEVNTSPNKGEVSYEALMSMQPSPKEDFNVQGNPEGGLTVTGYVGNAEMVYIPDEIDGKPVTEISSYTFANNQSPKAIRLGDNVKLIELGSFGTNETIEIFVAGKGLEVIGKGAFIQSEKLRDLRLNEGLKEIQDQAFSGTESLKEITIPDSVEKIGRGIFTFVNEKIVVKAKPGSVAEQYANEKGIKFEAK